MAAKFALAAGLLVITAACATRTVPPPPPLPTVPKYAEFVYPAVPLALERTPGAARIDLGWRYLQNDDLNNAEREFSSALKQSPALYPAQTANAYVALARREHERAVGAFDAALVAAPQYVPALVGRGQTLLALGRDDEALTAFESALAVDSSLADVRGRVEVLRFRNLQDLIAAARAAAAAGRRAEARAAYARAVEATPDSAFLHRELALLERQDGNGDAALGHFRRAAELDPGDAASLVQIGEMLEERQDYAGAEATYRRAAAIEPGATLTARIAALVERAREARLPAEFRAIAAATELTRGDLAALIGVRLEPLLRTVPTRQVVLTDIAGHWAASWVSQVAQAGVIEPFENHTFQPGAPVRRGDLATAISRLVAVLAADRPDLRARIADRPRFTDLGTGHLSYPAASVAVASGVIPMIGGDRFEVGRAVTGAEAAEAIDRVRALAAGTL
ncbi:MAG TPA: tetratricopeptide repeat protein [Vicinamibacterales bacterium]